MIATFPSRHYDIEQYPAVKKYLLDFGKERLEQTGKEHIVNGEKIKSRKKTGNKWFETQDQIGYWDDFNKPKIVYPETTQGAYFALNDDGILIDKTCFMMVGKNCEYIQKTLSSKLFEFAYKRIFSSIELGECAYQYNKHSLVKLPIANNSKAIAKVNSLSSEKEIDEFVFTLYKITKEEISAIENPIF